MKSILMMVEAEMDQPLRIENRESVCRETMDSLICMYILIYIFYPYGNEIKYVFTCQFAVRPRSVGTF
jgi:hypothetical protein